MGAQRLLKAHYKHLNAGGLVVAVGTGTAEAASQMQRQQPKFSDLIFGVEAQEPDVPPAAHVRDLIARGMHTV